LIVYQVQLAILALLATSTFAVQTITIKGADLVNSVTGNRFQIVGVAYQPAGSSGYNPGSDPLADKDVCLRDAALMQRLGPYNLQRLGWTDADWTRGQCYSGLQY